MIFYTQPYCPLCDEVREVLDAHSVDYQEVDVSQDPRFEEYGNEIPVLKKGADKWFYRERLERPLEVWLKS